MANSSISGTQTHNAFDFPQLETGHKPVKKQNSMSLKPYQEEKKTESGQQPHPGWLRSKLTSWISGNTITDEKKAADTASPEPMPGGLADFRKYESRRIMYNGALQIGWETAKAAAIIPSVYFIVGNMIGSNQTTVQFGNTSSQNTTSSAADLQARDVAGFGNLASSYQVVAPVLQSQAFWAMMAANGPILNLLNTFTTTVNDAWKVAYKPWLLNPQVHNGYASWDKFKKETLYDPEVTASLSPNLLDKLRLEATRVDRQFDSAMLLPQTFSNPADFLDGVSRKKDAISQLLKHFQNRDLQCINDLSALRLDNSILFEQFIEIEAFKHGALTSTFKDSLPPYRLPYLNLVEKQIDNCLKALTYSGDGVFTDIPLTLQKLDLQVRKITQGFVNWEQFKQDTLPDAFVQALPQPVAALLEHQIKTLEQQIDQKLNLHDSDLNDTGFMQQVENGKKTIRHLVDCCQSPATHDSATSYIMSVFEQHHSPDSPDLVGVENHLLTADFVNWENYKTMTLAPVRENLPAGDRRNHFDEIVKQVDREFSIALYQPGSVGNMAEHMEKISERITGLKKAFIDWEDYKAQVLNPDVISELPPLLQKLIINETAKHDKNLATVAGEDLATVSDRLIDGKDTLNYILACYHAEEDDDNPAQQTVPHNGVKNPVLLRNFVNWERYKERKLPTAVMKTIPDRPREHLEQGVAQLDREFDILLYEEHARADMRKSLQQITLKNQKMGKFFLERILDVQEVKGWTPEWHPDWKTPGRRPPEARAADEKQFREKIQHIDRMTDEYLDDKNNSRFNKDLINGLFLLDMARASKHVAPEHDQGSLKLKNRNWTKEEDWHVWDGEMELPNLIYYLYGPPGVGKGRLGKIIDYTGRATTNIEIPNIQQGGVASVWSQLWDAFLQFDFPTSEKDDVGSLILQVLATKCANPIWMINEPDETDPEGMKKLVEPFLTSLRSDSIRSDFPVRPTIIVTTNHLPPKKHARKGKAELLQMSRPMRDRGTVILLNDSNQKTVEQDIIDIYRGWAYYFATPFDNGAPARLTPNEQKRLQQIFKDEVYDDLVRRHRNNFDGSRMGTHVPAIMAKMVDRLLEERWDDDKKKKQIRPGEFKSWVKTYYDRYQDETYERESESESLLSQITEKIRNPNVSVDLKRNATSSFISRLAGKRGRSGSKEKKAESVAE